MTVNAANCNSNGNGNWSASGTWSCGTIPNNGDVIEIAANTTVTISSNITYSGVPMHVKVYGIWRFNGGGAKISMPCGSSILIGFGGQVIGNGSGNSQTIKICSTTYWSASNGSVAGPVAWPAYVLPVELTSFSGKATDEKVQLLWTTASEQDSEIFWIHRSRDGEEWDPAGSVNAAGQSSSLIEYSFTDIAPDPGIWYYKLLQIDTDGTAHEKGIISLEVDRGKEELICSLSAIDRTIGSIWPGREQRSASIVDLRGVARQVQVMALGDHRSMIDLSRFGPNAYILMVTDAIGERASCKFLLP